MGTTCAPPCAGAHEAAPPVSPRGARAARVRQAAVKHAQLLRPRTPLRAVCAHSRTAHGGDAACARRPYTTSSRCAAATEARAHMDCAAALHCVCTGMTPYRAASCWSYSAAAVASRCSLAAAAGLRAPHAAVPASAQRKAARPAFLLSRSARLKVAHRLLLTHAPSAAAYYAPAYAWHPLQQQPSRRKAGALAATKPRTRCGAAHARGSHGSRRRPPRHRVAA